MVPPTLPKRSPYQALPMSLLRSRVAMMRQFRPLLRAFNLSEQQWRVLRALSASPEMEIKDLARSTCLVPPSLSRILKNLNERELIARRRSDEDMRHGFVSISCNGLLVVEDMEPVAESIYAEIARRCGDLRVEDLENLLNRLIVELEDPFEDAIAE
jgi:homoprotocatechuate degradation regulator HpaR